MSLLDGAETTVFGGGLVSSHVRLESPLPYSYATVRITVTISSPEHPALRFIIT